MKKIFTMAAIAAATILAVSCAKEIEEDIQKEGIIAHASLQPVEATKAIGQYSYNIVWEENDKIAVLDKDNNKASFKLTDGASTTSGTFQQEGADALTAPLTAYYPASVVAEDKSFVWPATQADVKSISNVPMTAESSTATGDVNFAFKHLGCVLQLVLTAKNGEINVKKIDITADQGLSGAFTVENGVAKISSTGTTITTGDISDKDIKLSATASYLNFAVPSGSFTNFKITITDTSGKEYSLSAASLTLNRAMVGKVSFALDAKDPAIFEVNVNGHTIRVKLSDAAEDAGIADNLIVQCKPDGNSVKVEVYSKEVKPLVIRIGDDTKIIPDKDANFCTFTIPDITSDITATLAYAKIFRVTGSIVPDVTPAGGYLDNIEFSGIGNNIPEGRTVTVKVSKTVPGYHTKMVCDGRTETGDTIVLEDVSKDLEVSAHYEFYDYPLPGVFTVDTDGRKVKFARGNMWCQNNVLHNEDEQYQFSSADWALDGHISHFMWSKSLTESVKQKYVESGASSGDIFFTNAADNKLSPNPDLIVNGQKGIWRVLSGGDNGEWYYLLNSRTTTYGHRYAEVKVNDMPGLLIFPDTFTWPSGAGAEPTKFDAASSNWNGVNYQGAAFLTLQSAGCVFLPAAGYRDGYGGNTIISRVGSYGYYWSSTPCVNSYAYLLDFNSGDVNPAGNNLRDNAYAVRLVTECQSEPRAE